jgi:CRP/FNR family transcriptional regulator, nitrogen fixation regulation protein
MLRLRGQTEPRIEADQSTILKFRKGEIVYSQEDPATDWFEVLSGTVRTCYLYSDGHRQLTGFFYTGDVFGIDSGQYASSAEAVTPVTLRRNPRRTEYYSDAKKGPAVQIAYQSALNNAQACIFLLGRRTAAERLAAFLLATAKRFIPNKAFALPMSRSDIADHLGLTIHTVSRTLSEFVRRKLIRLDGPQSIFIEDPAALSCLARGDGHEQSLTEQLTRQANVNSNECVAQFRN